MNKQGLRFNLSDILSFKNKNARWISNDTKRATRLADYNIIDKQNTTNSCVFGNHNQYLVDMNSDNDPDSYNFKQNPFTICMFIKFPTHPFAGKSTGGFGNLLEIKCGDTLITRDISSLIADNVDITQYLIIVRDLDLNLNVYYNDTKIISEATTGDFDLNNGSYIFIGNIYKNLFGSEVICDDIWFFDNLILYDDTNHSKPNYYLNLVFTYSLIRGMIKDNTDTSRDPFRVLYGKAYKDIPYEKHNKTLNQDGEIIVEKNTDGIFVDGELTASPPPPIIE